MSHLVYTKGNEYYIKCLWSLSRIWTILYLNYVILLTGSYSLVEPGGAIRIVDYWADSKSGFNAIVRREGPKVHPATLKLAPIVKAPIYTQAVAPLSIGHIAPIAPVAAAPVYGALSTASIYKVSLPTPALSLPVAPIVRAPAIAPYAKTFLPAPLMPLPLLPNYLPSLNSLGVMNKLHI